ncbi:sulfite exporter TauE/SafE family protein [Pseudogemmobacter faecipullorum]|uniref:Probable membrane transporter protein n=1 Tax=Pseudogemmobacter faecipullorum TaxID=2755041 RepID=A0ABS8CM28_9RHOB|nr:sulfite exporter TauE/SafE family protein [Pseudogemmobacter faecipullorum]MCB5410439.1 sulfite exporter TauE/SafE family protein [Pseudogemmobacter faecipullorum]
MGAETIIFLMLGAFAGGFINGLAGFGTALLALGFWLQVLPPVQAVSMAVAMSVISGLQGVWIVRREISANRGRLLRFLLPALPGIPLGAMVLTMISAPVLKLTIAALMILYGAFFSLRRALPKFTRPTPVADSAVGFLGGLLGGAAGLSGALPTMWCAMRPWSKAETRAVLQPYNVIVLALTMLSMLLLGHYSKQTLLFILLVLPVTLIGAQLGISVYRRLSDERFRRLLILMLFASGLLLLLRELPGLL